MAVPLRFSVRRFGLRLELFDGNPQLTFSRLSPSAPNQLAALLRHSAEEFCGHAVALAPNEKPTRCGMTGRRSAR